MSSRSVFHSVPFPGQGFFQESKEVTSPVVTVNLLMTGLQASQPMVFASRRITSYHLGNAFLKAISGSLGLLVANKHGG